MTINEKEVGELNNNLKDIKKLIQQSIAIQLYNSGVTQEEIGKKLGVAKGTANKMVKGMKTKKKDS